MKTTAGEYAAHTLVDQLIHSLGQAARHQPGEVASPAVILWTDSDGQWRPLMPILLSRLPQLLVLGPYIPSMRTGPSIWLKCIIAGALDAPRLPDGCVPILYLPEVSRQFLRVGEECPPLLQPLVELQYRGAVWTQKNGKDWTVEAFLVSDEGLGLDMARDARTRMSMTGALSVLAETPVSMLAGKRLEAEDFDRLLVGDHPRDLLMWMNDPQKMRTAWDMSRWSAFGSRCREQYGFDPETDGETLAGERLGICEDPNWRTLWERYAEAPILYPGIPDLLRRSKPSKLIFNRENWPDANDDAENQLRQALLGLDGLSVDGARSRILELEKDHGPRREWVWTKLGQSALAQALEPLVILAQHCGASLGGDTPEEMARLYAESGFRADDAALRVLAAAKTSADRKAVQTAVRSVYLSWCEAAAERFQVVVAKDPLPVKGVQDLAEVGSGECVLFADGLRFDLAQRLSVLLEERGLKVVQKRRWSALPTVTATAKPAVSPAAWMLAGKMIPEDFQPIIASTEQPLTPDRFRKLLVERGYTYIASDESGATGEAHARGWTEAGQIDARGHELQIDLAYQVEEELSRICERILDLIEAGWSAIRVVTDHGWLLMPGELPKQNLPGYLVASRWARCAAIKGDSKVSVPKAPWYWNTTQEFATAPGISSFQGGQQYAHGGLSLQECLVADLLVSPAEGRNSETARITEVQWAGMRCRVMVEPAGGALRVDLRTKLNDPESSLAASLKVSDSSGKASLVVENEDCAGMAAFVVVLGESGKVIAKHQTTVGGAE